MTVIRNEPKKNLSVGQTYRYGWPVPLLAHQKQKMETREGVDIQKQNI